MNRIFAVESPEQLRSLCEMTKENEAYPAGTASRLAQVWSADRRRNSGKSSCDGKVLVSFRTENRERHACIFSMAREGQAKVIGCLKYNTALRWCEANLPAAL